MSARTTTAVLVGAGLLSLAPLAIAAERTRDTAEATGTAQAARACDDFVTSGGWITGTPTGARANFSIDGGFRRGAFWGSLNFLDHSTSPPMHVKGTSITAYGWVDEKTRRIEGTCTIDGVDATYAAVVRDEGEPGRLDTVCLQLSTGYQAMGSLGDPLPGGGNVQLHNACMAPNPVAACGGGGGPDF